MTGLRPVQFRLAGPADAEKVAAFRLPGFYLALGYEDSAVFLQD